MFTFRLQPSSTPLHTLGSVYCEIVSKLASYYRGETERATTAQLLLRAFDQQTRPPRLSRPCRYADPTIPSRHGHASISTVCQRQVPTLASGHAPRSIFSSFRIGTSLVPPCRPGATGPAIAVAHCGACIAHRSAFVAAVVYFGNLRFALRYFLESCMQCSPKRTHKGGATQPTHDVRPWFVRSCVLFPHQVTPSEDSRTWGNSRSVPNLGKNFLNSLGFSLPFLPFTFSSCIRSMSHRRSRSRSQSRNRHGPSHSHSESGGQAASPRHSLVSTSVCPAGLQSLTIKVGMY